MILFCVFFELWVETKDTGTHKKKLNSFCFEVTPLCIIQKSTASESSVFELEQKAKALYHLTQY